MCRLSYPAAPDLIVVGLGPAGASAAAAAAAAGVSVLAIDRKQIAGAPVQCAEFIPASLSATDAIVSTSRRQAIAEMHTYFDVSPRDHVANLRGTTVDRAAFDRQLVDRAKEAGAVCRFATTVSRIRADGSVCLGNGELIRAPVIIGGDGPRSPVGCALGYRNTQLVDARQITVPLRTPHHASDIFLSPDYHGGYGWLFPCGTHANLGVGVVPHSRHRLKSLLEGLHQSLVRAKRVGAAIVKRTGGTIPVGGMLTATGAIGRSMAMLCGDAAGLSNAITGAGINAAVESGRLAGAAAANYLAGERNAGRMYDDELRDLFAVALSRSVQRRRRLISRYDNGRQPSHQDLRDAWIAYPEYWAA